MKFSGLFNAALCITSVAFSAQLSFAADHSASAMQSLEAILTGHHRSEANIARNQFRHPIEVLEFFGLEPDMTLIEILPSSGWWTEVLAPYMRDNGKFYAAHFSPNASSAYMRRVLEGFEAKITAIPEIYGKTTVRHLDPPNEVAIAPPESADIALTFRNVHNWIMAGKEQQFFDAFYTALKPGGVLGVVEHRAKPGSGMDVMRTTGYVTEDYVIELAATAGFELSAKSEINANAKDTTVHPEGVWTLPPEYRLGDTDRAMYTEIGESDRMTLKFVKPL